MEGKRTMEAPRRCAPHTDAARRLHRNPKQQTASAATGSSIQATGTKTKQEQQRSSTTPTFEKPNRHHNNYKHSPATQQTSETNIAVPQILKSRQQTDQEETQDDTANAQGCGDHKSSRNLNLGFGGECSSTPTHYISQRCIFLFRTWVLISTIAMCVSTHHTTLPPSYILSFHLSIYTPTTLSVKCFYPLTLSRCIPYYTYTQLHQWPPPRKKNAPCASTPPLPPTQHKRTHTKVSKTTCTYHTNILSKTTHKKSNYTIFISLPAQTRCRRLATLLTPRDSTVTCQQIQRKPHTTKHYTPVQPIWRSAPTIELHPQTLHELPRVNTLPTPAKGKPTSRPKPTHIRQHAGDSLDPPRRIEQQPSETQHDPYPDDTSHSPISLQCKHHKQTHRQPSSHQPVSTTLAPYPCKTKALTHRFSHRHARLSILGANVDPRTKFQTQLATPRSIPLPSLHPEHSTHTCTHPKKPTQSAENCCCHSAPPTTPLIPSPSLQHRIPPHCSYPTLQIPHHLTHFNIPLSHSHTGTTTPPTLISNMKLSHTALATEIPRPEIALRSKTRSNRSTGSAMQNGHRQSSSDEIQRLSERSARYHTCSLKQASEGGKVCRQGAEEEIEPGANGNNNGAGDNAVRRSEGAARDGNRGAARSGEVADGSRGPGSRENQLGSRPKSGSRRRALIDDSSEDDGVKSTHHTNHPSLKKGKAHTYNDSDIDMQLVDVSPEHGGSSLHLSLSSDEFTAAPNQASALRLDGIDLTDNTPPTSLHKSPRDTTMSDNHSAKRRRGVGGSLEVIPKTHNSRLKELIPSIDIVSKMWLGFSIHEAIASHRGHEIIHEHRTDEEFKKIGTPAREITEFKTLRRAFPRVPQVLYSNERPDAVPGNHLHFTQIPR